MKKDRKEPNHIRNIKKVLIMIIIVLSISLVSICVYAFSLKSLEGIQPQPIPTPVVTPESTPTPSTNPTPDSTPTPNPDTPSEPETPQKESKNFISHTTISGNAFESLNQIRNNVEQQIFSGTEGQTDGITTTVTTDFLKKEATDPAIEGIKVELIDNNGNSHAQTYTDSNGNFSFNVNETANYKLRFTYGQYNSQASNDSYKNVKNSLKYNAQDYAAIQVGNIRSEYAKTIERTSMDTKNEIMIVLDYSVSMIENNRFKKIQSSAIKLVEDIFKDNDNVSVGLVMFSKDAYVKTRPINIVDSVIDEIKKFDVKNGKITYDEKTISVDGRNQYRSCCRKSRGEF